MPVMDNAHALVIGIAEYHHINTLPRVQDAQHIADLLIDPNYCGFPTDHVKLLLDGQATQTALRQGLGDLAGRSHADSTVLIFFSGHGGRIESGPQAGQYLLPVDTLYPSIEDLAQTAISGAEFTGALNAIQARRLTVVLDCCHAGGIGEPRDLVPAARSTDPAWVRPGSRYGIFTGHLLDGLRGAARGDGGVIRILDLYTYVQQKVVSDQPNQRPVLKVELEDNYPIALYRGGLVPAPTPAEKPADGFEYDVFVSYRQQEPDKTWARKILVPRLKAGGLKVFIDYLDFRLGAPIVTEMERAVVQSRYTVGVLSPNYLRSNFTELESILAEHIGLEQSQQRFIGVMRENCKPRLGIRARYYLDMTDEDECEAALARLVAQIRQAPDIERIEI